MHGVNSDLVLKMFFKGIKNLHYKSSHLLYCIGGAILKLKNHKKLIPDDQKIYHRYNVVWSDLLQNYHDQASACMLPI